MLQENAHTKARFLSDPSLWILTLSNLVTIGAALSQGWDLLTLMAVYWCQSIIIGIFTAIKIFSLKRFTTDGMKINGRPAAPTEGTKIFTGFFFIFHFGIFHLAYLLFISSDAILFNADGIDTSGVFALVVMFLINHAFSFFYNFRADRERQSHLGKVMFTPYARIIPMHLTIIIGSSLFASSGSSALVLVFFLLLKTLADGIMHVVEHLPDSVFHHGPPDERTRKMQRLGIDVARRFFNLKVPDIPPPPPQEPPTRE